jgi:outer membrane protein assembly factor BamD
LLHSCVDSQRVLKSPDRHYKFAMANKWFNQKKFFEAVPVIEDLIGIYKGTDTAQMLYLMLADCYFLNKEYTVAAYHYKTYKDLYSKTPQAELASFKLAECYEKQVPRIELEQRDTEKAIEYYSAFISEYPNSVKVEEAYNNSKKLKRILELKALQAADLYYKTSNFRAAAVTYKNVANKYPEIAEYEYLYYKIVKSNYKFAEQSILKKQAERYEATMNEAQAFMNRFPNSSRITEIKDVYNLSQLEWAKSSLKYAQVHFPLDERIIYFSDAISIFKGIVVEIEKKPVWFNTYLDECYLGILRSYFYVVEETKDETERQTSKALFLENYYKFIDKFTIKSKELMKAEEMYKKINNQSNS